MLAISNEPKLQAIKSSNEYRILSLSLGKDLNNGLKGLIENQLMVSSHTGP